ncbi:MAG: hypothetical protein JSS60_06970 [Verrucomicrobia bacterium]|nr:hypothetical protein [Verrucomicrobiota bacterium]
MQLYAFDNAFPISASKAEKGKDYHCPECSAKVRIRGGPSRQTHFYHINVPKNCRQHQKSLEHLQLQLKLFNLIGGVGVQIESPFPSIQRIADVAWHGKKIVFEIQCSPISLEEAQCRILDYQSLGYEVIWILHDRQFNRTALSAAENYLRTTPCYFSNIDKTGAGIVYDQFDVLRGSRRSFKGPPLPIAPTKISHLPPLSNPDLGLPQIVLQRLTKWKCYAEGDLLHRLLKEGNLSQAAKKMISMEAGAQKQKKTAEAKKLPIKELIVKSYQSLLDWVLNKLTH